jgi:DNA-directed RNA polymerase beta subunit
MSNEKFKLKPTVPNQLRADLLSVSGLNPWVGHNSSSRVQMFSSHISQKLVIAGANEKRCQTGMEAEFAKYTFSVKMPCDGRIIKNIHRYPKTVGKDFIAINPQTVVIYEDDQTNEIGIINIPLYCSYHQYFGFEYKSKSTLNKLVPGQFIPKDTIFMDSPAVTDDGGYMYGREVNMAFMSHPAASEDGIVICEDVLDKFKFKIYENRVIEWGSKKFPLNIYGDKDNFKPFPEIGEYIRDDGVLMILRSFDKSLSPVEQSIYDLMEPDYIFDKALYVSGPGGKIIDIKVHHEDSPQSPTPMGMEVQIEKYDKARKSFYTEIINEYKRLKKARGDSLKLTPDFSRLIVEAYTATDTGDNQRINKLYRHTPIDDYRVEFVIEYEITPTIGFKLTDTSGGKGVIVSIAKPEEMPVDQDGNRADIIMDANSTISRMNIARMYEHYINAASRDTTKKILNMVGAQSSDKHLYAKIVTLFDDKSKFESIYKYLMGYYSIVSPKMFKYFSSEISGQQMCDHLFSVCKDGIYLYIPTDNEPETDEIIRKLERHYKPTYGPVSYIGKAGNKITTKAPIRISTLYMMLLEKIGDDWAAVSSGKLQHFGILSQLTKSDKYSQPTRNQAVRAIGETEARIFVSYCGQKLAAELMDRNNNPVTHKATVWNILDSKYPTNIGYVIDRNHIKLGGAKPIQLINHVFLTGGIRLKYKPRYSFKMK